MTETPDLEALYQAARAALKSRDYSRASDLLRQILIVDEEYKDTSRLLAQMVRVQRRRWYNDLRLYAAFGIAAVIVLVIWLAPRLRDIYAAPVPSANTATPFTIIPPTLTAARTDTPMLPPTSTPIPLAWKRISMLQQLPRDLITAIAIHPKDSDMIYVGTQNAGLYRSIDGGSSWQPSQNGLPRGSVVDILIDPETPDTVYVDLCEAGVYKTENGGTDWKPINNGINLPTGSDTFAGNFSLDSSDPDHILFDDGQTNIYETKNGGEEWTTVAENTGGGAISKAVFSPQNANTLIMMNQEQGLQKSSDSGKTWQPIGPVQNLKFIGLFWMDSVAGNTIFFRQAETRTVYRSNDGGATWKKLTLDCNDIAFPPADDKQVYCADGSSTNIYKTTDAGQSWQLFSSKGNSGGNKIAMARSDPKLMIYATNNGLYISKNSGSNWNEISNGLGVGWIEINLELEDPFRPMLKTYLHDGLTSVYQSLDAGRSWKMFLENSSGFALDADRTTAYRFQGFDTSINNPDVKWTWKNLPAPNDYTSVIMANPWQAGMIYSYSPHITGSAQYSTDGGSTWAPMNNFLDNSDPNLAFAKDIVYASDGWQMKYAPALNPENWRDCGLLNNNISHSESRIAIDPRDTTHLLVATLGGGVLESDDSCLSWSPRDMGMENKYINSLAMDRTNPETIYAGTDGGMYVTFNGGQTWGKIDDGLLGVNVVYSVAVDKNGNAFAATPYGVFQLEHK